MAADGGSFRLAAKPRVILVGSLSHPAAQPLSGLRDLFEIVEVPDIEEAHHRLHEGGYAAVLCAGPTLPDGLGAGLSRLGCPYPGRSARRGRAGGRGRQRCCGPTPAFASCANAMTSVGQGFYAAIGSPEILGPDFSPFATVLADGEATTTRLQIGEKDFCQLHVAPISGLPGSGARLVVVVRRITSEMQEQQKLEAIHLAGIELTDLRPEESCAMTVDERVELLKSNILHHTQAVLDFNVVEVRLLDPASEPPDSVAGRRVWIRRPKNENSGPARGTTASRVSWPRRARAICAKMPRRTRCT